MLSNVQRTRSLGSPTLLVSVVLVLMCVVAAWGAVAMGGTKMGVALIALVALGPIVIYAALTAPMVFPFAFFVALVPFDNLLTIDSFGTLTKLLGLLCALALAIRLIASRRYVVPDRSILAWGAFVLIAVASLAWAMDPPRGVSDVLSIVQLFALYALVSFMPIDRKTLAIVIGAAALGGVLAGGYGAYLFHAGQGVSEEGRLFISTGERRIDPNHFGAALLVPLALSLVAFLHAQTLRARTLAFVAIGFIVAGLLICGSRGALISSAAVMVYVFLKISARKRMVLAGLAFAACGVAIGVFSNVIARFGMIAATGGAGRLGIWRVSAVAFWHHPLLGAGFGNFSPAYDDAFLTVPAFASMKIAEAVYWNIAPHNNLVWSAVELGAVGLVAFVYASWMQYRSLRCIGKASELYPLRIAVEAALVALFVDGLFLGTLTYKYLWLGFMLAMIVRNAEVFKGGPQREVVVSPVLQTTTRRG